ncbi:MAG: hypothetical protein ACYCY8_00445 [Burkholderiales bacterium]
MNTIYKAPTNKAEFIQLLDEAIRLADNLNSQLDRIGEILEDQESLLVA